MDLGLSDKAVFITGGGHGIGRAFALNFADEGAAVALAEIDPQRAAATVAAIKERGGQALALPCDVSDRAQVDAAVAQASAEYGQVDILINNAVSPNLTGALAELADADWDHNFAVNVKGSFYCIRAVAPQMKAPALRQNRQHGLYCGPAGFGGTHFGGLFRFQSRHHWPYRHHGPGIGAAQHQCQRHCAGQHRHPPLAGCPQSGAD